MGFALILAIQGYASLLTRTRQAGAADEWLPLAAAVTVAAALLWNPARTYLRPPDTALLLRAESRMREYFRGAWAVGAAMSGAALAAALALYYPLYEGAGFGDPASYVGAAAALLALKALLYAGAWRERRFRDGGIRVAFAVAKAAAAVATAFALLRSPLGAAHAWLPLLWAAYAAALRIPPSYKVHWERLLALERRTTALHEAWFGFFVDLPHRAETYRPRAYLNGLLRLLVRYERSQAFRYQYWRTLLRSSMAALLARLIALEALLVWTFPQPWAAAGTYAAFAWLIGLQLRGLQSAPSEPLLAAMSPLPAELRASSQRAVRRAAHAAAALLLAAPVAAFASPAVAAGCAAGGLALAFLFAYNRKMNIEQG